MARWKAREIGLLFLSLTVEALQGKICQNSLPSGWGRSLGANISGGKGRPPANILTPLERQLNALQIAADNFCIMKLCRRLFVLYCRSRPKDDKSRYFDPHFKEVMGGVEPWWMARWKASAALLLIVIGLLFLSLTVKALQGKMCQNSLPSGVGRSLGAKISGGKGRPWEIFFGFYKTRHILLSDRVNCTVLCAVVLTQYRRVMDGQTDRPTELP